MKKTRSEWVSEGWKTRRQNYGENGGIVGPPKVQFCPKGHDTFLNGRTKKGCCQMCRLIAQKKWRDSHKEQIRLINRKSDLKQYGLTLDSYTALLEKQKNRYAICGEEKTLVIDHCHKSGKVRGLLCIGCNTSLGHYESIKGKCESYLDGAH